jgi:DNA-binding NarL/FixJ family response regulator
LSVSPTGPVTFTAARRVRTTLVGNDELLRHGLVHVVSGIEAIGFVADLRYGPGLAARIAELRPDLLVLGSDGQSAVTDLLAELRDGPKVDPRIVVVVDGHDRRSAVELLRAGADALVDRRSSAAELRAVIGRVIAGQTALDAHSAAALIGELRSPTSDVDADVASMLTGREREVLALLVDGLDNRTIATRLFVSEATVKFHLHNIMNKFGVHKRAALISTALRRTARR